MSRWGPVKRQKAAEMDTRYEFEKRLGTLNRRHMAMGRGYEAVVRHDGLIVMKPKRRIMRRNFPVRGLALLLIGFCAFKGFMLASLGDVTYNERVAKMANGTPVEAASAWVMQIDPLTEFMAGFIKPLI